MDVVLVRFSPVIHKSHCLTDLVTCLFISICRRTELQPFRWIYSILSLSEQGSKHSVAQLQSVGTCSQPVHFEIEADLFADLVIPNRVGVQEVIYQPLVVGGGDELGTYRADSFICAAAVHRGLFSVSLRDLVISDCL